MDHKIYGYAVQFRMISCSKTKNLFNIYEKAIEKYVVYPICDYKWASKYKLQPVVFFKINLILFLSKKL